MKLINKLTCIVIKPDTQPKLDALLLNQTEQINFEISWSDSLPSSDLKLTCMVIKPDPTKIRRIVIKPDPTKIRRIVIKPDQTNRLWNLLIWLFT